MDLRGFIDRVFMYVVIHSFEGITVQTGHVCILCSCYGTPRKSQPLN